MKIKEDLLKTMKKDLTYLKEKFKVKSIGIFGSYARGEQTKESDLDMLVEFDAPVGFFKFIEVHRS